MAERDAVLARLLDAPVFLGQNILLEDIPPGELPAVLLHLRDSLEPLTDVGRALKSFDVSLKASQLGLVLVRQLVDVTYALRKRRREKRQQE